MSMMFYFFKAWIIGIAIAAPVGPIGMLCIKKTLEFGIKGALIVGFGAALADSIYGIIATFSINTISQIMLNKSNILKLIGSIFLLYIAYREFCSSKSKKMAHIKDKHIINQLVTVFFLTLTNPMTILTFIGVFASIGTLTASTPESMIIVAGIFFGSITWWIILGMIIATIKQKIPNTWFEKIKLISCIILICFALFSIFESVKNFIY